MHEPADGRKVNKCQQHLILINHKLFVNYPHIRQHDSNDCAVACVASICAYYGKEVTIVKLRELLGTDILGTSIKGIADALGKLGFENRAVRIDREGFESDFTLPAIAHIIRSDGTSHFVVMYRISGGKKKQTVTLMDPAEEKITKKSVDEFYRDFDGIIVMMIPNSEFHPSKNKSTSIYANFINLIKPHKKIFILSIAASVILTIFGIVLSIFNKILIDEIIPYHESHQLLLFAIGLVLVVITKAVLEYVRQLVLIHLSIKIDIPMMLGYFKHIFHLPMNFFASRKTGDMITRFQDAGVVKNIFTEVALSAIIDVGLVIISGVILFFMDWHLFLIIVALSILSAVLIFTFKAPYKKLNKEAMEQGARLGGHLVENISGVETVKVNASEDYVMDKIEAEYIKSAKIGFKSAKLSTVQNSLSSVLYGLGNLALLITGGFLAINGEITLGTLIAFISLADFFISPINRLVGLQLRIQEAGISLTRLGEIYDVEEEEETEKDSDSAVISGGITTVSVENVSFRYGSRPLTLKNISLDIPQGHKIAMVGRSGCGKTTLSKLLLKFYLAEEGIIKINGKDIKDIDAFALREQIGCIPQSIQMFSGSIRENIVIGNPHASIGDLESACRLAGCDEFVRRLPKNYDTFLDENGGGLSGGEKQRIAIARVLVKKPSFIIFDEATSSMDFLTEQHILDTIYNKLSRTSMMIIAHRLSTIRKCDRIYVMENGSIVEQGTHAELLSMGGIYARMWNEQMCLTDLDAAPSAEQNREPVSPGSPVSFTNNQVSGDDIEYN